MPRTIPVTGSCRKCGHTVNRQSEPGRLTWKGQCPVENCGGEILARRVPSTESPVTESNKNDKPAGKRKVTKVDGYTDATRTNDSKSGSDSRVSAAGDTDEHDNGNSGNDGDAGNTDKPQDDKPQDDKSKPARDRKSGNKRGKQDKRSSRTGPYSHVYPYL